MLDDLAAFGYVAAELADWVGPTSAELGGGAPQVPGEVAQVAGGEVVAPARLAITQNFASQGGVRTLPQASQQPAASSQQPAASSQLS